MNGAADPIAHMASRIGPIGLDARRAEQRHGDFSMGGAGQSAVERLKDRS